ncbi:TIR domain-containing protein [Actinoplanes sp. Pm04-4]|uniref:TIR domain-containing protein n=1 Tax=Paractinoplanes pyxinae TaxID=2997416 RepID=A0ABT4BC59_9ACTN|nr:TIR domain-containing protein [Actinoplanes pyxinae]MCY1143577.1 TIR domain-containing protein [Actinoplanes pyxinae]
MTAPTRGLGEHGRVAPYDAFVSYSHRRDRALAEALQSALQDFARPWYRPRALRIFRDASDLTAAPGLWSAIEQALEKSDWFVLMASPDSARSQWCRREVAWWMANRSPERFLIALTDGQIAWGADDFDWAETDAVPPTLAGFFAEEPLWVDMRSVPPERVVAEFAAPMHGRDKDSLTGEHLARRSRIRRAVRSVIAGLSILLVVAVTSAVVALDQRRTAEKRQAEAEAQTRIALSRQLSSQAEAARDSDPRTALRMGIASIAVRPGAEAETALTRTLLGSRYAGSLDGHPTQVESAVFSADGDLLVTADARELDEDGKAPAVRIWDLHDRDRPTLLSAFHPAYRTWAVAISPDSGLLAVAVPAGDIQLWDIRQPSRPVTVGEPMDGPPSDIRAMTFSPDGKTIAAAGYDDNTVRLWDVARPARPRERAVLRTDGASALAFRPDGRVLAVGGSAGTTHLWDVASSGRPVRLPSSMTVGSRDSSSWVRSVAFAPDGRTLALTASDAGYVGEMSLWNVADPRRPRRAGPPVSSGGAAEQAAFGPDGRTLAAAVADAGSSDFRVRLWSVADPVHPLPLGAPLPHRYGADLLARSPDGDTLVIGNADGGVTLWRLTDRGSPRLRSTLRRPDVAQAAAFVPDGRLLTAAADGMLTVWSDEAKPLTALAASADPRTMAVSPDGRKFAVGGGTADAGIVAVGSVDSPARPVAANTGQQNIVDDLAFSPDGRTVAAGSWDGTVQLMNVTNAASPSTIGRLRPGGDDAPPENVRAVAFAPDGKTLAVGSDRVLRLWDPAGQRPIGEPVELDGEAGAVAYSPDGRTLVAAAGNTVRLWDVASGTALGSGALHDSTVRDVAFGPDSRLLATTTSAGQVRLWDLFDRADPRQLGDPRAVGGPSWFVTFSPDGSRLAAGGGPAVYIWDLTELRTLLSDPLASACGLVGTGWTRQEWNRYVSGVPFRDTCPL